LLHYFIWDGVSLFVFIQCNYLKVIQNLESKARMLQAAPESEEEIKDVEQEFYPEVKM